MDRMSTGSWLPMDHGFQQFKVFYFCYMRKQTQRLYSNIYNKYILLSTIQEFGVQKFSEKWIVRKLSIDFLKSDITIERIIKKSRPKK